MPEFPTDGGYEFDLPEDLIAQDPAARREDSRLLLVEPGRGVTGEMPFFNLPEILRPGDLLVVNESMVLPARLLTTREDTGGQVEILLIRPEPAPRTWLALARPQRRLQPGTRLLIGPPDDSRVLEITERRDQGEVLVSSDDDPAIIAQRWGVMPLPPYIKRERGDYSSERGQRDRRRYQTVFARSDETGAGSVAAPTAGLHFSDGVFDALAKRGVGTVRVSLHVGPGTFRNPTSEQISAGRLHREFFRMTAETGARIAATKNSGGRVIAVGTTSLRVLETVARLSLPAEGPDRLVIGRDGAANPEFSGEALRRGPGWDVAGETRLFLRPPGTVTSVDGLLTNFHLPGSSLIMLVATVAGPETWPDVYAHAVKHSLRFYSYGDCMLVLPGVGKGS